MNLDLNLLAVLDALLEERSVTRAAARMGLSQPAMSNALARLRTTLGDPVLIRTTNGMVPTTKGSALGRVAASTLREVRRTLGEATFDPKTSRRAFTISASDYVSCVVVPPLLRRLSSEAPDVRLHVLPLEPELPLEKLETELDLTLGVFPKAPRSIRRTRLFSDRSVVVTPIGHPFLRTRRTLRDLVRFRWLRIASHGESHGLVDSVLAKHGLERRVVATARTFSLAQIVTGTDLIVFMPERLAKTMHDVVIVPIATPLPKLDVDALWHARAHDDPAHVWFRGLLMGH